MLRGSIIDAERIDKLTDGQKQCLRLVGQLKTSKEIARELGISPHTVDQRIKVAIRMLGVEGRADAARLLAEYDQDSPAYQGLVYQRPDIAANGDAGAKGLSEDGIDAVFPDAAEGARRKRGPVGEAESLADTPDFGERNDLNALQRMALILAIAFGSAMAFGAILAGLDALSRLN